MCGRMTTGLDMCLRDDVANPVRQVPCDSYAQCSLNGIRALY